MPRVFEPSRIGGLLLTLAAVLTAGRASAGPPAEDGAGFASSIVPIPAELAELMRKNSWRPGCPVPIEDLRLVKLSHFGFDAAVHQGELVVHRDLAEEVVEIFRELFAARFPIERMRLIEEYGGSDDASMADDNTSAFNCRPVPGKRTLSRHSFGMAIDVNPKINPWVRGERISPPEGAAYADRTRPVPGMIRAGDPAHSAFTRRGWSWGGSWKSSKDFQHFEKKRKP